MRRVEPPSRQIAVGVVILLVGAGVALTRIRDEGSAELPVNPAVDHLFLVDPRGEQARQPFGFMRTHPPLDERIDLLERMGG